MVAAPNGDYGCLIGIVKEICHVGTPEHDEMTDNQTDSVVVDFSNEYGEKRIEEIVGQFRDLFNDDEKTYDDIAIDLVVMAPDELLKIDMEMVGVKYYNSLLDSEARAASWCFCELQNFSNSQPKGVVYSVTVTCRINGEAIVQEFDRNTECSAYEYACRRFTEILDEFGQKATVSGNTKGRGCESFYAGGITITKDNLTSCNITMNRYRWIKLAKTQEDKK